MTQFMVTGANRGLGLEFVQQLLARGDRVIAACRHAARASELNRLSGQFPGRLKVLPLDLGDPRSIAEVAREVAMLELHVDVLIHNAGVLNPGETFGAVEAKALTQAFVTNAQGPFLLTQSMAGHLRDGGRLIAVSSGLGSMARSSRFGTPSYNISKAALNMVVRMLGFALADRRIAVLAISPGWVKTDMGGENAELEPAESVADMLKTIDTLEFDAAAIGTFRDRHGALLPW